jgi:hypothetical protein
MKQDDKPWLGEKWSDDYPHYRVVIERYPDGTQKEIWRGTISMEENEMAAWEERDNYLKQLNNGTTE